MEEGLAEFTGEDGLGQVPEVLLHHVGDVEGGLTVVGDAVGVRLQQLSQVLDAGLHPRLPEKTHLGRDAVQCNLIYIETDLAPQHLRKP